jgi:hypothetical protein
VGKLVIEFVVSRTSGEMSSAVSEGKGETALDWGKRNAGSRTRRGGG